MSQSSKYRMSTSARAKGDGIYDVLKNTVGRVTGESGLTLPGSNYCGPFNSISEDYQRRNPPRNRVDAECLRHDLAYDKADKLKAAGDTEGYNRAIRAADLTMTTNIDNMKDKSFGESATALLANNGIKLKMGLDRITGAGARSDVGKRSYMVVHRLLKTL